MAAANRTAQLAGNRPCDCNSSYSDLGRTGALNRLLPVMRVISVLATGVLLAGLESNYAMRGVKVLDLFWQGFVPLLPITLLVAPHFWRRICPFSVLNLIAPRRFRLRGEAGPPRLPHGVTTWVKWYGVMVAGGLVWLLVPVRLLLFNRSPRATMVLLLAMAAAAFALGIAGPWKAAWCSSMCPVYPLEKFYGTAPVWPLGDSRCTPATPYVNCYRCSLHCLDVPASEERYWRAMERAGSKPAAGFARRLFVGSFPGFVSAYWLLTDVRALAGLPAPMICASFLLCMTASYACYVAARRKFPRRSVELTAVAFTVNVFYVGSSAGLSTVLSQLMGWQAGPIPIRAGIIGLALLISACWLRRAPRLGAAPWGRW